LGKTLIPTTGVQHRVNGDTPLRQSTAWWQQSFAEASLREADPVSDAGDDLWQQGRD